MESGKTNTLRKIEFIGKNKSLLGGVTLIAGIMIVLGWSFAPSSVGTTKVSAAGQYEEATAEMLAYALNFKSASNLAVFGGSGVTDRGPSQIRGPVGSTGEVTGVNAENISSDDYSQARRDLTDAFSYIDQLPCAQVDDANLGGRTFGPGVYCFSSANLAGRMAVDAGGDANASFVFRINGTFKADDASSIDRIGGAVAKNVYIVARGTATIGGDATIGGNIISHEDVIVGNGSTITGKVIGVDGTVTTNANIIAGASGYIEICKQLGPNERTIAVGTIFTFTVDGLSGTVQVPAGAFGSPNCSPPIKVEAGNTLVTETARTNTSVVDITTTPSNRLVNWSSGLQQAVVAVVEGEVTSQTVVTFTNQTTRTGTIEICKFGLDTEVTGFFNFTVQGAPGQTFSVPVGYCSGQITVTLLQANPSPSPTQAFTTNITELARTNFRLENVTTFPSTALTATFTPDAGFDAAGVAFPACPAANCNLNGGVANVSLNIAGGAANQTTVRFWNRSLPGRIKVCKITADTVNIPVGTAFSYTISGLGWVTATNPGSPTFMPQTATFDVLAGPPAQGGFCSFAPLTWLVGSPVFIGENGINAATNTISLPLGLNATNAALRVSRIQASTPFVTAPVTVAGSANPFPISIPAPNENIFGVTLTGMPNVSYIGYGVINARNTTAEIEFTNFVYRPAILKLCKVAGPGVAVGTNFSFSIAPADPLTTWPYPTTATTVPAGSCTFINGPFPADPSGQFGTVKLFNFGTSIVVTEAAAAGTTISNISSPTGTLTPDIPNRRGTLTLNQILNIGNNYYFNELTFTNIAALTPPPSGAAMRYDFDGDHKSDVAIFRPSNGTWWYAPSSDSGGEKRGVQFGQAGDIPVAADYDGDGITDQAVYRNGMWHVLGSSAGYMSIAFGLPTDIPQPGDYDGDHKADFAVFRPSDGVWYVMGSASGFHAEQFGISTDIPVAGDYDADGKMDEAVFRDGIWYINMSTNGFVSMQFGAPGDLPIPGDYDGDGHADEAVYRGGTWFYMGSYDGFRAVQFGLPSDKPVPADYDGDGKTDFAVYRPSTSVWHIMNSSQAGAPNGGYASMQFGSPGDQLLAY